MATQPNPQYLAPDEEEEIVTESTSLSKIEEADRSAQIETARKYPRSITKFVTELTELATLSQPTAMSMIYSLPRAGKQLVGPSVRFAEAVAACWGNLRVGVEVVDVDRHNGFVVSEGRYYDCEKNMGLALRKRRRIVARQINADSIQVTGDAGNSIALRDAILRGVPKAIWEPVWQKAKQTAAGSAKSMEIVREQLLQVFHTLGVTDVQIFNALEVSGPADLGADQILAMNAWRKQLNEHECTIEDIFGSPLDEQIQLLMDELGWNQTKQRMSREAYKGRREEHLDYLKGLAAKNVAPAGEKVTSIKPETTQQTQPQGDIPPQQPAEKAQQPTASKTEEAPAANPPAAQAEAATQAPRATQTRAQKPARQGKVHW